MRIDDNTHSGPLTPQPSLVSESVVYTVLPDPEQFFTVSDCPCIEIAGDGTTDGFGTRHAFPPAHLV